MKIILVVEDEGTVALLVQYALGAAGYQIERAHNGQEALDCLARLQPHAILADIMMPIMDGRTLYQTLRLDDAYRALPFALMSAGPEPPDMVGDPRAAFLSKPFTIDQVQSVIGRLLG
jgi:CheY-like chemotaxis protein